MNRTSYIDLASVVCFKELRHDMVCLDKHEGKIAGLHEKRVPTYEAGLDVLLARNVAEGQISLAANRKVATRQVRGRAPTARRKWYEDAYHVAEGDNLCWC